MASLLGVILQHPDEIYPLLKLKMAVRNAGKKIPQEPHWSFCFSMLPKFSNSYALLIQQLGPELRNAVCVFYLVLRALDTVEDDTSIPKDVKVPILKSFYQHIDDLGWHFSCGRESSKVLMDQFHCVSTSFMELDKGCQEVIVDITRRMGAGMAKFICKEGDTTDDYDEYCHYVAGLVGIGLSKLFHAYGLEDLADENLSNIMAVILQKENIIRDFLEDIDEKPMPRMFWPRQIWSKYVDKLEDLKYEENSMKAVQCLNEMITNALVHVENCFKYMSALKDPLVFRFCAISQVLSFGNLAMCYNKIELFRCGVKLRRGIAAKVYDQTHAMGDVYGAFYDFSQMMKSKIDDNDPTAKITLSRLESIQKICRDSGALNERKSFILENHTNNSPRIIVLVLAFVFAYHFADRLRNY